jgi:OOP family OmpA-OmpF porin
MSSTKTCPLQAMGRWTQNSKRGFRPINNYQLTLGKFAVMKIILSLLFCFAGFCTKAQLPRIENSQLVLDNPVVFATNSDQLTDDGVLALKQVKEFLVAKEYITILRVEGHSDNTGNEDENLALTQKRALAVCKWLVANGIDCKRLVAVGFGSNKPIDDNSTPMGRAANRRMVFAIAGLNGRLMGGMPADGGGAVAGDPCK